jgi:hypothetical protein
VLAVIFVLAKTIRFWSSILARSTMESKDRIAGAGVQIFNATSEYAVASDGTSVGRGWDSVGHTAGIYRNRMRIECLEPVHE